jgi:hypothetical protein
MFRRCLETFENMANSANAAQNTETRSLQKQRNRALNAGRLEKGKHSQATKTAVDNSTSNKCGDAPATVENKEANLISPTMLTSLKMGDWNPNPYPSDRPGPRKAGRQE